MLVIYALRIRFDNKANSKQNGKERMLKKCSFFFRGNHLKSAQFKHVSNAHGSAFLYIGLNSVFELIR